RRVRPVGPPLPIADRLGNAPVASPRPRRSAGAPFRAPGVLPPGRPACPPVVTRPGGVAPRCGGRLGPLLVLVAVPWPPRPVPPARDRARTARGSGTAGRWSRLREHAM